MEPGAGAPWEWQPLPKTRQETKTRIKAKNKVKNGKVSKEWQKLICECFPDTSKLAAYLITQEERVISSLL